MAFSNFPSLCLDGNVCLNILREDWKPVLTINSIVYGLQYLFLEPNPDDPLNKEAATELQANRDEFSRYWQHTATILTDFNHVTNYCNSISGFPSS